MKNLEVKQIDYKLAMEIVIQNHYLHRKCPCSIAFGLFNGEDMVGVIIYGKPSSYTLCEGLAGKEESKNVIEFNRMWICDTMPKNTGSWFISKTLKLCNYEIIVSFADSEQGHVGYVYQASNWLYCGISKKQKYFRLKDFSNNKGGSEYRRRERMSRSKIIKEYGEEYIEEYYSSLKYRYVYFNTNKKRKKELLSKLRYEILKYPKNNL
jgi:hypothetical protein